MQDFFTYGDGRKSNYPTLQVQFKSLLVPFWPKEVTSSGGGM